LAVRSPEVLLFGLFVAVMVGAFALKTRATKLLGSDGLRFAPVIFAATFPFIYFAMFRPVAYNGMRHFLFVIPPLCVIAALAFQRLLQAPSRVARLAFAAGLALAFIAQARMLIELHPDEYTYFNTLVGGPRGARGRYELDYWGISLAEATERLVDQLDDADALPEPGKPPLKVYVCGNVWSAATFFPESLTPVERVEDADFQIAIDDFFCKQPAGSKRVLEVTRAGATLSYVDDLRRLRAKPSQAGLEQTRAPSVNPPQRRAGLR
ncbi:MAG TPA: hypothetical protein VGO84_04390, partial [Burkholderiales bacterium]|nr:hypothetical protein [Burkholderiales bacterium]